MPAGDGTGPRGDGPQTGWGTGYCSGYERPGWANPEPGRRFYGRRARWGGPGQGQGRGGRGRRNRYYGAGQPGMARWGGPPRAAYVQPPAPPTREQEIGMLRDEAEWLKEQLDGITRRMAEVNEE